jgi:hypothetical protein
VRGAFQESGKKHGHEVGFNIVDKRHKIVSSSLGGRGEYRKEWLNKLDTVFEHAWQEENW